MCLQKYSNNLLNRKLSFSSLELIGLLEDEERETAIVNNPLKRRGNVACLDNRIFETIVNSWK